MKRNQKWILIFAALAAFLFVAAFTPLFQGDQPPIWAPLVDALRLNWFDLLLPVTVLIMVYLANAFGLANTPNRKRIAGLFAALAVSGLRVAMLGISQAGGGLFDEYIELGVMAAYAWLAGAGLYTGQQVISEGVAAVKQKAVAQPPKK